MASAQGRDPGVARVYAKAMLSLAEAQGQAEELLEELAELGRALAADPELAAFLATPLVGEQVRAEVLETIFRGRASDLLVDALEVINRKGRLWLLPAIVEAFRGEYRELRGLVDARVTTAVPLGAAQRSDLLAALARFTGKRPELLERRARCQRGAGAASRRLAGGGGRGDAAGGAGGRSVTKTGRAYRHGAYGL